MRRVMLLWVLPLFACTLLIKNRQPAPCDGAEPRCEGDVLVQCAQGLELRRECAPESCDPVSLSCVGFCGDGQPDAGEACDDGAANSDTAPNACRVGCTLPLCGDGVLDSALGEQCEPPGSASCDAACLEIVSCGDGLIAGDEECDDANTINTDACKNSCALNLCGDGVLFVGDEECDDANLVETDFCKTDCSFNVCGDGAFFAGNEECDDANQNNIDSCSNSCRLPRCGDAIIQGQEQCDDANTSETDDCLNDCSANVCGDGFVDSLNEVCDDGNISNTDTCLNTCVRSSCGDGFVAIGQEQCDGANLNGQSCTTLGFVDGALGCAGGCLFDTSACNADADCGDGVLDAGESCDDNNASNTDACLANCQGASCGDGFVQAGVEDCDDQNASDNDLCNTSCAFNVCGDGAVLFGKEDCDDENLSATDACIACRAAFCGDGFVQAGVEACDDQNTSDNDACKSNCSLNVCGDGAVLLGQEQCDDGNNLPGDGCEPTCDFTPVSSCGDSVLNGVEACDDGNTAANDGCGPSCAFEADFFVLCDGALQGGSGSLTDPFHSISQALSAASSGDEVMILPQSQACGGVLLNKSITLFGLADARAANPPPPPVIDGGQSAAVSINAANLTVIIRDLRLQNNGNSATVGTGSTAKLALLRTSISNPGGLAIDCNMASGGRLLLDQSTVSNSPAGGLSAKGFCRAVIANSLFQNNGSSQANAGAILIQNNNSFVDALLSTFDGNTAASESVMTGCGNNNRGRLDSSIVNQNNTNAVGAFGALGATCLTTFSDTFGALTAGSGNLNVDPLFENGFQLGVGSLCIDTANPAALSLLFDPLVVFGVDVFAHDFSGRARPVGGARDMGMFEAP